MDPVTPSLCRYITQNPSEVAKTHEIKSALYTVAMVVSAVAAVAIFGTITAVYLGLLSESLLSGWGILGALLCGCAFMQGVDTFSSWRKEHLFSAEWNREVAVDLGAISHWTDSDIARFYGDHRLGQIRPGALSQLQHKSSGAPLKNLLPLISFYRVACKRFAQHMQIADEQLRAIAKLQGQPNPNHAVLQWHGGIKEQNEAIASLYSMSAAFYLQCLHNPTREVPTIDALPAMYQFMQEKRQIPHYSWMDKIRNYIFYRQAIPEVNGALLNSQHPREVRRLLFAS